MLNVGDKALYKGNEVEIVLILGCVVGYKIGLGGGMDHINLFTPIQEKERVREFAKDFYNTYGDMMSKLAKE